jgi:hypothetical protein
MSKIVAFAALALCAVACAAPHDENGQDSDATEADLAAGTTKWFDCNGGDSNAPDQMSHLEVGWTKAKLTVTDLSKDAMAPTDGKLDPSYHPTSSTYAGSIRYSGFDSVAKEWDEVSSVDFMVSKEIQDGKPAGKMWMRTAGPEGGGTSSYWCKSKDAPIKVKTSVKSRLACDLTMLCKDDNPPGSTCLDAAFIQQTDAKTAKMRVEYLDHFGVHVVERKVELGSDDTVDRDAKSFKATVDGNKIDLKYRGGITYEGEFTLKDGRKTKAKCNDLAMLDD